MTAATSATSDRGADTTAAPFSLGRAEATIGWIFVVPFLVGLALFLFGPTLAAVGLAFTDWQMGAKEASFIGIANFREVFADRTFQASAANTLMYGLIVTPASIFLGLLLALGVEKMTIGRAFFRSVFFLPVVSTTVAMAVVWEFLLHPTLGPVNSLLFLLGLPRQNFLGSVSLVLPTLAGIGIWENVGFNMVLIMAGLKTIPQEMYEAASIDGADRPWERFWTVTLPLLGPCHWRPHSPQIGRLNFPQFAVSAC